MSSTCPCESRHKIGNGEFSPADWRQFYIGPGAKIYGDIKIVDGIAIGTNAVVNESFLEPNITIAGIPDKKVSEKGSEGQLIKGTDLAQTITNY